MLTHKIAGMTVITVFGYRGAKIYIRAKGRFYEQLIIYRNNLFTHYFEAPPNTRGRQLYQEEEMNMTSTIIDVAKETVDEIISQRSPIEKVKSFIHGIQSKAADLFAEWKGEDGERLKAEASRPLIQIPEQASGDKAEIK